MAELIIESVPSGAEVQIDGVIVGTTPLTRTVYSWDVLKAELEDHTISKLWWSLTEYERRSIAKMAIVNTIPYKANRKGIGEYGCIGNVGGWISASCVHNTIIRYAKFASMGSKQYTDLTNCYWKRYDDSDENCFVPDYSYALPCHAVSHGTHSMIGVHVVAGFDSLDNWIVFQYSDIDIKPGHWQMPIGRLISVNTVTNLQGGGYGRELIVEFNI